MRTKKYLLLTKLSGSMVSAGCGFHTGAEVGETEVPGDVEVDES